MNNGKIVKLLRAAAKVMGIGIVVVPSMICAAGFLLYLDLSGYLFHPDYEILTRAVRICCVPVAVFAIAMWGAAAFGSRLIDSVLDRYLLKPLMFTGISEKYRHSFYSLYSCFIMDLFFQIFSSLPDGFAFSIDSASVFKVANA